MSANPDTRTRQTLDMANEIVSAITALATKYPDTTGIESLWIAALALYGVRGVAVVQALSVNVARSDL